MMSERKLYDSVFDALKDKSRSGNTLYVKKSKTITHKNKFKPIGKTVKVS